MANTVNLEFAGDADKLARESKRAEAATLGVGDSALEASRDMQRQAEAADASATRTARLTEIMENTAGAFDAAGAGAQALADVQDAARQKAQRLAQAANDVAQAQEDMAQATRDARQAQIDGAQAAVDMEQAQLDQATALEDYNEAVKEFGAGSLEARQAQIDMKQAGIDLTQAQEDQAQATRDANQANIDARQGQLDLNEAMHEANPPELQQWADQINMVTPLLSAVVGVIGLVTAAQWAWNAAQLASPTTWIILAIAALIAIIVLIATKTDWFQRAWRASWGWIKTAAANTWDFLKKIPGWIGSAFRTVTNAISAPFRNAFAMVRAAWNSTVGRLSWTVPGWVPGIGGNSISAPRLHQGGTVPGAPGQEVMTILQAGETVTSMAGSAGGGRQEWIRVDLGDLGDALLEPIARAVGRRGGRVEALGVVVVR